MPASVFKVRRDARVRGHSYASRLHDRIFTRFLSRTDSDVLVRTESGVLLGAVQMTRKAELDLQERTT